MRYRAVTERIGENMGPVDWSHATASGMPEIWREAERDPQGHLFNGRELLALCMYDGWPYWVPTPAIQFIGPLRCAEWTFFNSYGVSAESIKPKLGMAGIIVGVLGVSEWQPIETAPKDGTRVLLYRPTRVTAMQVICGHWTDDKYARKPRPYWTHDWEAIGSVTEARAVSPTHWQPLPSPPPPSGEGEE